MPRSGKPIDEKLNEALERVSAIRREKRRQAARERREERDRRLEAERHLGAFHFERLEQLAASDPAAAAAGWNEVRDWAGHRVRTARGRTAIAHYAGRQGRNGAAGTDADGRTPGAVRISVEDGSIQVDTPARSAAFAEEFRRMGGGWDKQRRLWTGVPAGRLDDVAELARRCFETVRTT